MGSAPQDVTQLLQAWSRGEASALEKLLPSSTRTCGDGRGATWPVSAPDHSLQTTDLIHEAYLRLVGSKPVDWQNRSHFFALSARLMRQILVDHARSRGYRKRGGGRRQVDLDEGMVCGELDWDLVGSTTPCRPWPPPTRARHGWSSCASSAG